MFDADLLDQLRQTVSRRYGARPSEVRIVRAPYRICPLGAHIDHQLGIVTGMTIDEPILLAFAPTGDGSVHVESVNFPGQTTFPVAAPPPHQKGDWANYVRGAALALQQEHQIEQGFVGMIGGSMPIGGLSSSAAVTTAYLLALEAINRLVVEPAENVALCRYTENRYIGLNNGILDQSVILFSAENHLTRIDCLSVEVERVAAERASAAAQPFEIAVVYSGVTQALVGTDYNSRVAECQEAARRMLEASGEVVPADPRLRHVPVSVYQAQEGSLPDNLRRRARHFFGEMDRVASGIDAWRQGDMATFGRLVNASGQSSVENYQCGSPQLITLYETLRDAPGVYGARFSGAGFRGNCIALIDPAARDAVAEAVHARYPLAHPDVADRYSIHFCRPDGPARLLENALA
jgi:galactokinase